MKITEKFYIAGLFDGEGWVSAASRRRESRYRGEMYVLTVGIVNTHEATIRYIHSKLGGTLLRTHHERYRPLWRWQVQQGRARDFLKWIGPCLIIKKEQARLAVDLWNIVDEYKATIKGTCNKGRVLPIKEKTRRDNIITQLRVLNGRIRTEPATEP